MDPSLELWGGIECTVNRVGETYFDQLTPLQDVSPEELADAVATLGITKLRVPVLWERVAPNGLDSADWAWTDRILTRLRQQGIAPIAGLVHHGSGPRGTDLLDRRFPDGLARFAEAVALRYPWIEEYTPINEPLTTARFAALYGLWYPHRSDERSFATALLMQCAATRAAVHPLARPTCTLLADGRLGQVLCDRADAVPSRLRKPTPLGEPGCIVRQRRG